MNVTSVPEILKDESLFAACALEAASHVLKQPPYISQPIAAYGACVAANIPAGRVIFVDFMRAMYQAHIETWTNQLNDPLYVDELDRLENTIAHSVYLAYVARNIQSVDQS